MTYLEEFAKIKEKLAQKDTGKCKEQFAIQVTLTDEDCHGVFYIANTADGFAVEPYDYRDHTAHLIIDSHRMEELADGTLEPVKAYLEGEIQVEGNLEHIKELALLRDKPKRKPRKTPAKKAEKPVKCAEKPAKKTTKKKTEVKETK